MTSTSFAGEPEGEYLGRTAQQWYEEAQALRDAYQSMYSEHQQALQAVAAKQRRDLMRWDGAEITYGFGDPAEEWGMMTDSDLANLEQRVKQGRKDQEQLGLTPFEGDDYWVRHHTPWEPLRLSGDETWKDEE